MRSDGAPEPVLPEVPEVTGTRAVLVVLLAAAVGGCALERTRDLPVIAEDEVSLVVEDDGPWRDVPDARPETAVAAKAEEAVPPADPETTPTPVLAASRAPIPQRRAAPPARVVGQPRVPADLSRERYLRAARERWVPSVAIALLCWAFVYGIFDRVLHVPLPPGELLKLLGVS